MAAWALALAIRHLRKPILEAIGGSAQTKIANFNQQALANIAWSLATSELFDGPLLKAIAPSSITNISAFAPPGLANIAWAFARFGQDDSRPLLNALAE